VPSTVPLAYPYRKGHAIEARCSPFVWKNPNISAISSFTIPDCLNAKIMDWMREAGEICDKVEKESMPDFVQTQVPTQLSQHVCFGRQLLVLDLLATNSI
jgi:hypothetical protein